MTPKVKMIENVFQDSSTEHRIMFRAWPSLVKIGRCEVAEKKLGLRQTRPSPNFAQNRPIAIKIP